MNMGKGMGLSRLFEALKDGTVTLTGHNWQYNDTDYHLYWLKAGKGEGETFTVFDDCSDDMTDCTVYEGTQGGLDENEEEIWDDDGEYPEPLGIDPVQGNGHDGPKTTAVTQALVAWCRAEYELNW